MIIMWMITHKQYSIFLSTGNLIGKTQIITELQEDGWYVFDMCFQYMISLTLKMNTMIMIQNQVQRGLIKGTCTIKFVLVSSCTYSEVIIIKWKGQYHTVLEWASNSNMFCKPSVVKSHLCKLPYMENHCKLSKWFK